MVSFILQLFGCMVSGKAKSHPTPVTRKGCGGDWKLDTLTVVGFVAFFLIGFRGLVISVDI